MWSLSYNTLDTSYPTVQFPCQSKNAQGELLYGNQCAIRMSLSLIGGGVSFGNYTEPKCKHGHARGAESLANWLSGRTRLGLPRKWRSQVDARNAISGLKGIVFFKDCFQRSTDSSFETRRGDHIDLWDGSTTKTYNDFTGNQAAREVWFWELPD